MHKISTLICLVFLTGCSNLQLYDGEKMPPEKVVEIRGMSNLDISAQGFASKVCAFDGNKFSSCQPFIEFLPGTHKLTLESSELGFTHNTVEIEKEFKAGERYQLGLMFKNPGDPVPALMFLGVYNSDTRKIDRNETIRP